MKKYTIENVYTCNFCGESYISLEELNKHLEECTYNFIDHKGCLTCKHCNIHLVPPYGKDNGYSSLRVLKVTGIKSYAECDKGIYDGKLTEEKLLREDKKCFEGINEFSDFKIIKDKEWLEYKGILDDIDVEQDEIDDALNRIKKEALEETKNEDTKTI